MLLFEWAELTVAVAVLGAFLPVLARWRWEREWRRRGLLNERDEQRVMLGLQQALDRYLQPLDELRVREALLHSGQGPADESAMNSIRLLQSWLSPTQLEQFTRSMSFDVIGNASGNRYHIVVASSYNIQELAQDGEVLSRICVGPRGIAAVGDVMLAQKIGLETNELETIRLANYRS